MADENEEQTQNYDVDPGQTGDDQPEPPRLYAGKFKTIEEMETGYIEAQRRMHEATEQAANALPEPPAGDLGDQWAEQFYQNPLGAMQNLFGQYDQARRTCDSAVDEGMESKQKHPLFGRVRRQFERELKQNANFLVDPNIRQAVVDQLFERAVGRHALAHVAEADEDAVVRSTRLKALGVEAPEPAAEESVAPEADTNGREMLAELGLGKNQRTAAIEDWKKRLQEE